MNLAPFLQVTIAWPMEVLVVYSTLGANGIPNRVALQTTAACLFSFNVYTTATRTKFLFFSCINVAVVHIDVDSNYTCLSTVYLTWFMCTDIFVPQLPNQFLTFSHMNQELSQIHLALSFLVFQLFYPTCLIAIHCPFLFFFTPLS